MPSPFAECAEDPEALALVTSRAWYHAFEVLPGLVTPGRHPTDAAATLNDRYRLEPDLTGLRALDIGTLDGPYAFEMERRGAAVVAMDIQSPDVSGFSTAQKIRRSSAVYVQGDCQKLDEYDLGAFDLITFFGVWYHLKNPQAAFDGISRALKPGGRLFFEGECLLSHVQDDRLDDDRMRAFANDLRLSNVALTAFYPGHYKGDRWSWYVPNPACVRAWCDAASMTVVDHGFWDDHPHQRMFGTAIRGQGAIPVDNPVWQVAKKIDQATS